VSGNQDKRSGFFIASAVAGVALCIFVVVAYACVRQNTMGIACGVRGGRFWMFSLSNGSTISLEVFRRWPCDQSLVYVSHPRDRHGFYGPLVVPNQLRHTSFVIFGITQCDADVYGLPDGNVPLDSIQGLPLSISASTPYWNVGTDQSTVLWFTFFIILFWSVTAGRRLRRRWLERRDEHVHSCPACGYNLSHSPGRCPEGGRLRRK
jgi:hypothetical protein